MEWSHGNVCRIAGLLTPLLALHGCVGISKDVTVEHRQFFWPEVVSKTAVSEFVNASSGTVSVGYRIGFANVQVQNEDAATVNQLRIENRNGSPITVDIVDRLYCDAGAGTAGALLADVYAVGDLTIAGGATFTAGPFGPFDAGTCSDVDGDGVREVVNRVEVYDKPSGVLLRASDIGATLELPISGIVAGRIVDEEQIPTGWAVQTAEVLDPASTPVTVTTAVAGQTHSTSFLPGAAGEYLLTKTLARAPGHACAPVMISDTAYATEVASGSATVFGDVQEAEVELFCADASGFYLDKQMRVHNSMWWEPRVVAKTSPATAIDASAGTVTLTYQLEVDAVLVSDTGTAEIPRVRVVNTTAAAATVDITDTLYCDDGTGHPGAKVADVYSAAALTLGAGVLHQVGPFGPFDVSACQDHDGNGVRDVIDQVQVHSSASSTLLAAHDLETADLSPPNITAISGIAAGSMVDEEVIPSGWKVGSVALLEGATSVAFTASASASSYTVSATGPTGAGTYTLTKVLTRKPLQPCARQLVTDAAYMTDLSGTTVFGTPQTAAIELLCGPP